MSKNFEFAEIVEDSSDSDTEIIMVKKPVARRTRQIAPPLKKYYNENLEIYEIGVDEVGRGPLFGRVYTAAVILPKDDSFDYSKVKDSKKFHSKKKIEEAAEYVKENALAWYVSFEDEKKIDEINILLTVNCRLFIRSLSHFFHKLIHSVFCFIKSFFGAFTRFPHKLLLLLLSIKLNIINKTVKKWSFK